MLSFWPGLKKGCFGGVKKGLKKGQKVVLFGGVPLVIVHKKAIILVL
jgi:hypothetical protein